MAGGIQGLKLRQRCAALALLLCSPQIFAASAECEKAVKDTSRICTKPEASLDPNSQGDQSAIKYSAELLASAGADYTGAGAIRAPGTLDAHSLDIRSGLATYYMKKCGRYMAECSNKCGGEDSPDSRACRGENYLAYTQLGLQGQLDDQAANAARASAAEASGD